MSPIFAARGDFLGPIGRDKIKAFSVGWCGMRRRDNVDIHSFPGAFDESIVQSILCMADVMRDNVDTHSFPRAFDESIVQSILWLLAVPCWIDDRGLAARVDR